MKKPMIEYGQFRLNKINDPQFSHLKLLLGWVAYLVLFFLTENLVPAERCYPVHCWLDDLIPFCELFLIPYVAWYFLIIGSLVYFLLYNVDSFKRLQKMLIVIQMVAIVIFVVLPSRQDLRPAEFPRDNFLTRAVGFLYSIDTNTGVCPSMHVAFSLAIASVWVKQRDVSWLLKAGVVVFAALVCLATVFLKQHSAVDFFAAIPLCLAAEAVFYGKDYWLPRLRGKQSA